jgi:hypothetical protein
VIQIAWRCDREDIAALAKKSFHATLQSIRFELLFRAIAAMPETTSAG